MEVGSFSADHKDSFSNQTITEKTEVPDKSSVDDDDKNEVSNAAKKFEDQKAISGDEEDTEGLVQRDEDDDKCKEKMSESRESDSICAQMTISTTSDSFAKSEHSVTSPTQSSTTEGAITPSLEEKSRTSEMVDPCTLAQGFEELSQKGLKVGKDHDSKTSPDRRAHV